MYSMSNFLFLVSYLSFLIMVCMLFVAHFLHSLIQKLWQNNVMCIFMKQRVCAPVIKHTKRQNNCFLLATRECTTSCLWEHMRLYIIDSSSKKTCSEGKNLLKFRMNEQRTFDSLYCLCLMLFETRKAFNWLAICSLGQKDFWVLESEFLRSHLRNTNTHTSTSILR